METPFLTSLGFSSAFVPLLPAVVAGVLALSFFADYFRRKRSEAASIAPNPSAAKPASAPKPSLAAARKPHARSHQSQAADKDQTKRHHPLDVNTLKGHGDSVTALCFSSDGRNLATVCADGVIRVFRLDDATSKSFKLLRINLPAGAHPTAVAFSEGECAVVVAAQMLSGSSLYMYADVSSKTSRQQSKLPHLEIRWEHHKIHDRRITLTLNVASVTYGSADGSTILASCSEVQYHLDEDLKTLKMFRIPLHDTKGSVLQYDHITISPDGKIVAAICGSTLQWSCAETGKVLDVADKSNEGDITGIAWAPHLMPMGGRPVTILATAGADKKVKLWASPELHPFVSSESR